MVEPHPSSAGAEAGAWNPDLCDEGSDLLAVPGPPLDAARSSASNSCVLPAPPESGEWLGQEQRQLERYPVQASRPIAVRLLDEHGQPQGHWLIADILDISRGGLCLMVSGPMQLPVAQRLQLDVRCHPDFSALRLESLVRWCRSSSRFSTLGLAFREVLPRVPRLELERRSVRRDPNTEAWAQE